MEKTGHILEATSENFAERVLERSRELPVVVDFWAGWCAPCQMLMPILHSLAEEYGGRFQLVTVDTDREQQLAMEYGVRSLPTVKLFRHGEVVDEFMGLQPESFIRQFIDRHIEKPSDKLLTAALVALDTGNAAQARTLLEQAHEMDPHNLQVTLALARVLIRSGAPQQAQALLDSLSFGQREEAEVRSLRALAGFARAAAEAPPAETLERRIEDNPDDLEARFQLGARRLVEESYQEAMDQFLEIMRRDRGFRDDLGRRSLLEAFEILGDRGELVNDYRKRMARHGGPEIRALPSPQCVPPPPRDTHRRHS